MPVRSLIKWTPSANRDKSPRNLLMMMPHTRARSSGAMRSSVPMICAKTPPRSPQRSTPSPTLPGHQCAIRRGPRPRHRGMDLRCRGRRDSLHCFRFHSTLGHRPVDRASRQRRPLPRCVVPGVALSPIFHRLRRSAPPRPTSHPPPPRHHRNRLRRPDRRTPGAHALRPLRRQLGLDPLCGHRTQPAARHRRDRRQPPRRRPWRHPAPHDRQHPGPPGPPATTNRPAPTPSPALGRILACIVAQYHW